ARAVRPARCFGLRGALPDSWSPHEKPRGQSSRQPRRCRGCGPGDLPEDLSRSLLVPRRGQALDVDLSNPGQYVPRSAAPQGSDSRRDLSRSIRRRRARSSRARGGSLSADGSRGRGRASGGNASHCFPPLRSGGLLASRGRRDPRRAGRKVAHAALRVQAGAPADVAPARRRGGADVSRCSRFEEATRRDDPAAWQALLAHAAECADCREEIAAWDAISSAAPSLKKSWESPELWPRIATAMAEEPVGTDRSAGRGRRPWTPLAVAAALFVIAMVGRQVFQPQFGQHELLTPRSLPKAPLLEENTLNDVEKSEQQYVASIERLSRLAEPRLSQSDSPL